jgi:hypothetical protein
VADNGQEDLVQLLEASQFGEVTNKEWYPVEQAAKGDWEAYVQLVQEKGETPTLQLVINERRCKQHHNKAIMGHSCKFGWK